MAIRNSHSSSDNALAVVLIGKQNEQYSNMVTFYLGWDGGSHFERKETEKKAEHYSILLHWMGGLQIKYSILYC